MSSTADFWKSIPAQTAYVIVKEMKDVRPSDPGFDLWPGFILMRMDDGTFAEVAPGIYTGGIVLSDQQVVSSLRKVEIFYAGTVFGFANPADKEFYKQLIEDHENDEVGPPAEEPAP